MRKRFRSGVLAMVMPVFLSVFTGCTDMVRPELDETHAKLQALQELADAVNWVRYCNAPATDEWGAKRAANGHPEPYNVKYWEIDNEMWEMGIERYEQCVRDFSTAMRKVDPSIKIIACGGFREDEQFIQRSGQYFDYLSLHHYEQQNGYAITKDQQDAINLAKKNKWLK